RRLGEGRAEVGLPAGQTFEREVRRGVVRPQRDGVFPRGLAGVDGLGPLPLPLAEGDAGNTLGLVLRQRWAAMFLVVLEHGVYDFLLPVASAEAVKGNVQEELLKYQVGAAVSGGHLFASASSRARCSARARCGLRRQAFTMASSCVSVTAAA